MSLVVQDPDLPAIDQGNFSDGTAIIVNDAPGYQIEYSPVTTTDPEVLSTDCRIYGVDGAALIICIKSAGSSLIAGNALYVVNCD
jgi:hypothetical protein